MLHGLQGDPYTLVIALDVSGSATGELYLDDGKSFAYERGVFAHRVFTFKDGTLTNKPLRASSGGSQARKEYKPANEIERIIVLGLHAKKGKWLVSAGSSSSTLEAVAGPLTLQSGLPDSALVVRKPGLAAVEDWSLTFESSSVA